MASFFFFNVNTRTLLLSCDDCHQLKGPRGPMDKAPAYGAGDSRFDPGRVTGISVETERSSMYNQCVMRLRDRFEYGEMNCRPICRP